MELQRRGDTEAALIDGEREVMVLLASNADLAEFESLLARVEAALCTAAPAPRVIMHFDGGLLSAVVSDIRLDVFVAEQDPDEIPTATLRRRHPASDPRAVDAAIELADRRATQAKAAAAKP